MFWLLDEESKLPKPTAEHVTNEVHAKNKEHFRISVPRKSKLKAHRDLRDHEVRPDDSVTYELSGYENTTPRNAFRVLQNNK